MPTILNINATLLNELESRLRTWNPSKGVGDIFLALGK